MYAPDDWQREVHRYLDHFARTGKRPSFAFSGQPQPTPTWTPAMDAYETADALVIVLDLAGVNAAETEVRAEPGRLVIRGVRQSAQPESAEGSERRTYHALEIPYGPFQRILALPLALDTEAAAASYRDGMLTVRIPKRAPRRVEVEVSSLGGEQ